MRVCAIQMESLGSVAKNISQARSLIRQAIEADSPDMVVLPELWMCLGGSAHDKEDCAERLPPAGAPGPVYRFLQEMASAAGVFVHGGSIIERGAARLLNTSLVFDRQGREIARYRKIHLFDALTPSGESYRESALFQPGEETTLITIEGFMTGLAICYDVRFPELFDRLRRRGADIITLPAAFTRETGSAHWHALLRARAIDTQCWVIASNMTGAHHDHKNRTRHTYGHSMIIDPWGTICAERPAGAGWISADIHKPSIERARRALPVFAHRRLS